jgi:hypothetical protein
MKRTCVEIGCQDKETIHCTVYNPDSGKVVKRGYFCHKHLQAYYDDGYDIEEGDE